MCADDPSDVVQVLTRLAAALEVGYWRRVLRPPEFGGQVVSGGEHVVRCAMALRLVAISMQRQAQGRLLDGWDRLSEAASLLPARLFQCDASTGVALALLSPVAPGGATAEERLAVAVARLVWREQAELRDLRERFAPERMKAHDELIEAIIHYLFWVEFDPSTYCRRSSKQWSWDDGVTVERSRTAFCRRASEIRRLGDPTATVAVSQAPWQDGGGFRGLYPEALDLLAEREEPAPWCGRRGTSGLVVRRGRLRAWQYARRRREDLDSW
jgi:hypothetical protein